MNAIARLLLTLPIRRSSSPPPFFRSKSRLNVETLEDRTVPSRPLPYPVIAVGSGENAPASVRLFDAESGQLNFERGVFESSFTGGVNVGSADFTGDGYPDLVVSPSSGGGPRIRVLDGKSGEQLPGRVGDFLAYGSEFRGGVRVAAADVDGDDTPDIIATAGAGGGPHVRVFSGRDGSPLADYFVFDRDFRGGVTVAAADFTGDGRAEVVVGAGKSGGPRVRVLDALTGKPVDAALGDFFAFDANQRGGVNVGTDSLTGDVDGDGVSDLVVGSGAGSESRVKVYSGKTGEVIRDFVPFDAGVTGGVRVAAAYVDNDNLADIVVGTGPGTAARIRVFSGETGRILSTKVGDFSPFSTTEYGGVNIAATNDPPGGTLVATDSQTWTSHGREVHVSVNVYGDDPNAPDTLHWEYTVENVLFDDPTGLGWFSITTPVWADVTDQDNTLGWAMSAGPGPNRIGLHWAAEQGDDRIEVGETGTFTFDTPVVSLEVLGGEAAPSSYRPRPSGPILAPAAQLVGDINVVRPDNSETDEGWVSINNDNDNYNFDTSNEKAAGTSLSHIHDALESTQVVGENDLVPLKIHPTTGAVQNDKVRVRYTSPNIKLWKSADKDAGAVVSGLTEFSATKESTIYVEGLALSKLQANGVEVITLEG